MEKSDGIFVESGFTEDETKNGKQKLERKAGVVVSTLDWDSLTLAMDFQCDLVHVALFLCGSVFLIFKKGIIIFISPQPVSDLSV